MEKPKATLEILEKWEVVLEGLETSEISREKSKFVSEIIGSGPRKIGDIGNECGKIGNIGSCAGDIGEIGSGIQNGSKQSGVRWIRNIGQKIGKIRIADKSGLLDKYV